MNNEVEPIRDATTLGIPKMLILGLQHMFAMFGATILVPISGQQLILRVPHRYYPFRLHLFCRRSRYFIFPSVVRNLKFLHFLGSSFAFSRWIFHRCNIWTPEFLQDMTDG